MSQYSEDVPWKLHFGTFFPLSAVICKWWAWAVTSELSNNASKFEEKKKKTDLAYAVPIKYKCRGAVFQFLYHQKWTGCTSSVRIRFKCISHLDLEAPELKLWNDMRTEREYLLYSLTPALVIFIFILWYLQLFMPVSCCDKCQTKHVVHDRTPKSVENELHIHTQVPYIWLNADTRYRILEHCRYRNRPGHKKLNNEQKIPQNLFSLFPKLECI